MSLEKTSTALSDEDRDQLIDLRDALVAKGPLSTLSVLDQNLFRDCTIALGLVRSKPETREKAKIRTLREIRSSASKNEVKT